MSTRVLQGVALSLTTIALTLALLTSSKEAPKVAPQPPEPSREVARSFQVGDQIVYEFRDSAGRICVLVSSTTMANTELDCSYPRDYGQEQPE